MKKTMVVFLGCVLVVLMFGIKNTKASSMDGISPSDNGYLQQGEDQGGNSAKYPVSIGKDRNGNGNGRVYGLSDRSWDKDRKAEVPQQGYTPAIGAGTNFDNVNRKVVTKADFPVIKGNGGVITPKQEVVPVEVTPIVLRPVYDIKLMIIFGLAFLILLILIVFCIVGIVKEKRKLARA